MACLEWTPCCRKRCDEGTSWDAPRKCRGESRIQAVMASGLCVIASQRKQKQLPPSHAVVESHVFRKRQSAGYPACSHPSVSAARINEIRLGKYGVRRRTRADTGRSPSPCQVRSPPKVPPRAAATGPGRVSGYTDAARASPGKDDQVFNPTPCRDGCARRHGLLCASWQTAFHARNKREREIIVTVAAEDHFGSLCGSPCTRSASCLRRRKDPRDCDQRLCSATAASVVSGRASRSRALPFAPTTSAASSNAGVNSREARTRTT